MANTGQGSSSVRFSLDGRLGWIVLDQPDALNPLGPDAIGACREALQWFAENDATVVFLTGSGRAFCAGADLNWVEAALNDSETDPKVAYDRMFEILESGHALIQELIAYPGVVVSLVNGPAVGGGVGLALAADIVIAAKSAFFSLPFVPNLGLVPDLGAVSLLQKRIGGARTAALSLLGEKLTAQDAVKLGLIWACVEDAQLQTFASDLGSRLAGLPRSAVAKLKHLLVCAEDQSLGSYLAEERLAQAELFAGSNARAAILGFLQRHRGETSRLKS